MRRDFYTNQRYLKPADGPTFQQRMILCLGAMAFGAMCAVLYGVGA